jgi:hypothetical protein
MTVILTPGERAEFKRCRRAWDLGAPVRRNLEPVQTPAALDMDRLIRDALAVYYFPGMWDWSRIVVLPLVSQALEKGLGRLRSGSGPSRSSGSSGSAGSSGSSGSSGSAGSDAEDVVALRRLLAGYLDWAPSIERLAPVLVEVDYEVDLADPDQPDMALRTRTGDNIRYRGRIDVLAMDEHDAYWIVQHRVVDRWTPLELLIRDEETTAACWAWEQYYLGMSITGTIHNELRVPSDFEPDTEPSAPQSNASTHERGGIPQSDGSGGGRSIPQHRRLYARSSEPEQQERVVRDIGPWFRRTWIRRPRAEIDQAGRQLATEARRILDPDVSVYPSPSELACGHCPFVAPCQALYEGEDAEAILADSYRPRPSVELVEGRLGGVTWSTGRGAAPPRFS